MLKIMTSPSEGPPGPRQNFFDRNSAVRVLLALIFAASLFVCLHFKETYLETLELGSKARRYIVAQVDFSFNDEEATILLRQETARSLGPIYRLTREEVLEKLTDFQKYITHAEEGSRKWNEIAKGHGFEELTSSFNSFSDGLFLARFTDAATLEKIHTFSAEELSFRTDLFFVFLPSGPALRGKLPPAFWNTFGARIFAAEGVPKPISDLIISYFRERVWQFEEDEGAEYTLRKLVQGRIPQLQTPVRAGDRIIDKGERVTPRSLAMMQAMKEKMALKRNLLDPFTIAGSLVLALLFLLVTAAYLRETHPDIVHSNRKLALLGTILLGTLFLAKAVEWIWLKNSSNLQEMVRFPLFVPLAAILLASLMGQRIAIFASLFLSVFLALILALEPLPFLMVNILAAMAAILGARHIHRRKEVFLICTKAWVVSLLIIFAFHLNEGTFLSLSFVMDGLSAALFLLITAVLVVGLLPLFEMVFQVLTDITLMEFMDPGHELLRRLSLEAPGTYHHSIVMGNLAESAAAAIGASGLFCRVATQYHDIGKLFNPQYFSENRLDPRDPHANLTPEESARIIISHIVDGVALARKVGLPEPFIDIIKEHHGTTHVYYFYHKQLELVGGDRSQINEMAFRYRGPLPRTKESTIIMIADTLEAAARTLPSPTEESLMELANRLIMQKGEDGQFDASLLTFEELSRVKCAIVKALLAVGHLRIKYPSYQEME